MFNVSSTFTVIPSSNLSLLKELFFKIRILVSLWWWLPLRLSKRQSTPTTVLLRTTLQTQTITQTTTLTHLGSNLSLLYVEGMIGNVQCIINFHRHSLSLSLAIIPYYWLSPTVILHHLFYLSTNPYHYLSLPFPITDYLSLQLPITITSQYPLYHYFSL